MNHNKAFTLLEVLLVVAAVGILSTIVIVAINPIYQFQGFRDAQRQRHVNDLSTALTQYVIAGNALPEDITVVPKEVCDTGDIPGDEEPQPDCGDLINLSFLVPTHISKIPSDPAGSIVARLIRSVYAQTLSGTGYVVAKGQGSLLITQAPKSERRPISSGNVYNPYSLGFDGAEGSVLTTPGAELNLMSTYGGEYGTGSFTAWVYNSEENEGVSGTGIAENLFFRYLDVRHSDRRLRLMIRDVANSVNYWPTSNGQIPLNSWIHVVFILKGAEGYEFYINGNLDKRTNNSNLGMVNYGITRIGRSWASGTEWIGTLNNVRIYNRALSEQEIQNLYNGIHIPNGLVGWWNFNEGEGTTTEDLSGNGNHGTLNGGVTWSNDTPN